MPIITASDGKTEITGIIPKEADACRIVAAVNACQGIDKRELPSVVLLKMVESLERAEFLMRRVSEGDHRALENLGNAADDAPPH